MFFPHLKKITTLLTRNTSSFLNKKNISSLKLSRPVGVFLITLFSLVGYGALVFASPNIPGGPLSGSGGFTAGTELDPDCAPNQVAPEPCVVKLPPGESTTANNGLTLTGTNVQLGGTLVKDTDIIQGTKTLTSTFNGTNGSFGFVNGNYGPLQTVGMFYIPTATPYIVTGSLVSDIGANLATRNYITTEQSVVSAWIDPGTGEHRSAVSAQASDASNTYAFTAFGQQGMVIMSEYNDNIDFTSKMIQIGSDSILQQLNYSRVDNQNYLYNQAVMDDSSLSFSVGNSVVAGVFSGSGKEYKLSNIGHEFKGLDLFANQYPNTRDDSGIFTPVNFLYTDSSGKILSAPTSLLGGGSGWALTGNAGTDGGLTNFIGTTDAQDFVVKTNGNKIATFGQFGNIAMGTDVVASGDYAIAMGLESVASGYASTALGFATTASGVESTAFGNSSNALGDYSTAAGTSATASGDFSTAIGNVVYARSFGEIALGYSNIDYTPVSTVLFEPADRLFSIGNLNHNAYTLWKDGSFAYNDDNFQNDTLGTEQNMFYFNYGNHDGLGGVNTKRAIRLGSVGNPGLNDFYDSWDINSANVGDRSIALGFAEDSGDIATAVASGQYSIAIGSGAVSSGLESIALGYVIASGQSSFAAGNSASIATGYGSIALGGIANGESSFAFNKGTADVRGSFAGNGGYAYGNDSIALGLETRSQSFSEFTIGLHNTIYTPVDTISYNLTDRLFNIGNGTSGSDSDAFTILKDGRTAVAVDNFEANALPLATSVFQVGDGATGIIGYVDSGTGNWVAVSDERKKHDITDINYGLADILKLRPVAFNYNRNNEHTIGFLAQQVLPIIPESVYGTEQEGYGMSYQTLVPVTVKAIQELNIKLSSIESVSDTFNPTFIQNMRNWFADAGNGITKLFAHEVETEKLCVKKSTGVSVCITGDELDNLLNQNQVVPVTPSSNNLNNGTNNGSESNTTDGVQNPSETPVEDVPTETIVDPQTTNNPSVQDAQPQNETTIENNL